jgi:DNA-binding transcriptional ArsR family regulator
MPNHTVPLDRVFWALGDATRFAIIESLAQAPATVSELARPFHIALPTLLQHLGALEECGLITSEKVGRVRTCTLNKDKIDEVDAWLHLQKQLWGVRLDTLDRLLETKK